MNQRIPMTPEGEKYLKEELNNLRRIERPTVIKAIAEAREHGDLKENAEYHAAREKQGFIEARITDLEYKLSNAQVIDVKDLPESDIVVFGTTVVLYNFETEEEVKYKIVGEDEMDIEHNKISITSPLVRAFIGKSEGDEFSIKTPNGVDTYEVVDILYI